MYDEARGGISGFWHLTSEKTVWGDQGGNFQVAMYTVFHEESESEVENKQILEPGGKKLEEPTLGIPGSNFLFPPLSPPH